MKIMSQLLDLRKLGIDITLHLNLLSLGILKSDLNFIKILISVVKLLNQGLLFTQ